MKARIEEVTNGEHGLLRAKLAQLGFTPANLNAAVGQQPQGRTRAQLAADLAGWLKTRPKAQ